jgi:hypothetical protein
LAEKPLAAVCFCAIEPLATSVRVAAVLIDGVRKPGSRRIRPPGSGMTVDQGDGKRWRNVGIRVFDVSLSLAVVFASDE